MRRIRKRHVIPVVALLVVVATIGYLLRWTPIVANQVSGAFTENLLRDRGYRLEIDKVRGNLMSGLIFDSPRLIAERTPDQVVAEARTLSVRMDAWGLLRGRVTLHSLELTAPRVWFGPRGIQNDLIRSKARRGPRAPVPRFHVGTLKITDGRLAVRGLDQPTFLVNSIDLKLGLDSNAGGVSVDLDSLSARLTSRSTDIHQAAGQLAWRDDSLHIADLSIVSTGSKVQVHGWFDPGAGNVSLQSQVEPLALEEVASWVELPVDGHAYGAVAASWIDEHLQVSGRWTGVYEGHHAEDMFVDVAWDSTGLDITTAVGLFDRTPVDVEVGVDSAGAVTGVAHFSNLNLRDIEGVSGLPESDLRGRIDFATKAGEDTLRLDVQLGAGTVADWQIDEAEGHVEYLEGDARISAATLRREQTVLRFAGLLQDDELQLDFSAFSNTVAVALARLDLQNADAMLEMQGSIIGPLENPLIESRGILRGASWDDMRAGEVEFALQAQVGGNAPGLAVDLRAKEFGFRNQQAERLHAALEWDGDLLRIRRAHVVRADTAMAIAAYYRSADRDWLGDRRKTHQLQLETALLQVGLREIRVEDAATLWWTDTAVHIDSLRLVSRGGRLRVDGGFDLQSSRIDGRAEVEDFDLEFLSSFTRWEQQARGRGTGWFEAHGDLDRTQVDARLRIVDGSWNSLPFDSLRLEIQSDAFSVEMRRLDLSSPFGDLAASGRFGYLPAVRRWVQGKPGSRDSMELATATVVGKIQLTDLQLDRAWMARSSQAVEPDWQARVTTTIDLQGTVQDPQVILLGQARDLVLPQVRADSLVLSASYAADSLQVRDFAMQVGDARLVLTGMLPVTASLESKPRLLRDRPVQAHVELPRSSFAVVQRLIPLFEAVPQGVPLGEIEGQLEVSGTLGSPTFQGDLQTHGVAFTFAGMEEVYQDVRTVGIFEGNTLRLQDIQARIGKDGRISGDGELQFGGLEVIDYHFGLHAERILINSIPEVLAVVSGDVEVDAERLRFDQTVPRFTGKLLVHEALITQEFGGGPGGGVLASTDLPEWLADMTVDAPNNVWIKNTTVDAELQGTVQVVRNTAGMSVNGVANIKRGNYSLYLERFEITRGELDFSRHPGFQPEMDIEARQGRPGSRIYVHLTGQPPDNLRWRLSSDRGETSDELQQALFLSPENDPFNVTTTVVERIFQDLEFIESFHIDPANDSLGTNESAIVPFNISAGKAISDRVFLVYTQGLNQSDINQRVAVEIDIVRGLLLATSYTRRNIPDSATNRSQNAFDIDLKFRYEY